MIPRILLIEDDPAEVLLVHDALAAEGIYVDVNVARSAEQALETLDTLQDGQLPDLVLLDLHLPRMSGRELLLELKRMPRTRNIPVVVLTSSDRDQDVDWCYANHASAYVNKPIGYEEYARLLHSLVDFYFRTARLPSRSTLAVAVS